SVGEYYVAASQCVLFFNGNNIGGVQRGNQSDRLQGRSTVELCRTRPDARLRRPLYVGPWRQAAHQVLRRYEYDGRLRSQQWWLRVSATCRSGQGIRSNHAPARGSDCGTNEGKDRK